MQTEQRDNALMEAAHELDHDLRAAFLDSMASNSTSVHVVTTGAGNERFGVTVSACSSVCADPPTLLVCINTRSPANAAIAANGVFAVNLLNVAQRGIADTFAGRSATARPFDFSCCTVTAGMLDVPLIDGAVAAIECRLVARQTIGTHTVFFGEVAAIKRAAAAHMPLLYCKRDYGQFLAF
ncbi:FMN reductase [Caballeronia sordidicola]|uniref:FMN reductase n=1 Tax=Caballeronia sordidicola TaxID=196367 RepID=A0A158I939_CABSO|nr:flavin reductase family protein [Caballeronia sordidicola]SAL52957.1 FMN reductase [Caballeronia sordidicola]